MPEDAEDGFDSAVVEKTNPIDPEIKHGSLLLWGCPPIYNKALPAREGGIWPLRICACWSFAASAGFRDVLTIRNLTKSYGSLLALDDISLTLEPGEFFGLLGPNGAGKTTSCRSSPEFGQPTAARFFCREKNSSTSGSNSAHSWVSSRRLSPCMTNLGNLFLICLAASIACAIRHAPGRDCPDFRGR
ncbi:MAG: ATP-binding cassette domain-containing protein [Chthoniobacterales bacterium]|nr:ATP-binding cassette domain-containing protein [Chthoniobacterales bacterium]